MADHNAVIMGNEESGNQAPAEDIITADEAAAVLDDDTADQQADNTDPESQPMSLHLDLPSGYQRGMSSAEVEQSTIETAPITIADLQHAFAEAEVNSEEDPTYWTYAALTSSRNTTSPQPTDVVPEASSVDPSTFSFRFSKDSGEDTAVSYRNASTQQNVLDHYKKLHDTRTMSDVTIIVGETKFPSHRLVLSMASPFFERMFESQMKETFASEVPLRNIDSDTFQQIFHYMYLQEVSLTQRNVQSLLMAADMLQMESLQNHCTDFLITHCLQVDNAVGIWHLAQIINHHELTYKTYEFILKNFSDVTQQEEFFDFTIEELLRILKSDCLSVKSEDGVANAIFKWLREKNLLENESSNVYHLFKCVRLPYVSQTMLKFGLNWYMRLNEKCKEAVEVEVDRRTNTHGTLPNPLPRTSTGLAQNILIFGGAHVNGVPITSAYKYDLQSSKQVPEKYTELPGAYTQFYKVSICSTGTHVFMIGMGAGQEVWCYNIALKTWSQCASLPKPRRDYALLFAYEKIYLIAGASGDSSSSSIEEYDIAYNRWQTIGNLSEETENATAVAHEGSIYVFGGRNRLDSKTEYRRIKTIQQFDLSTKCCTKIGKLPKATGFISSYLYGDFAILIHSGIHWIYNVRLREGNRIKGLHIHNFPFATALANGRIYVLGVHVDNLLEDTLQSPAENKDLVGGKDVVYAHIEDIVRGRTADGQELEWHKAEWALDGEENVIIQSNAVAVLTNADL